MLSEHAVDCAALYRHLRRRLIARARGWTDDQLTTPVPATPLWTVQNVLAHLVGITADLNALDFGPGDADAWTEAQVRRRRGRSVDDLGAEWEKEGPRFEEGLGLFGYELGSHYVGDLLQHAADIDQAFGTREPADGEALAVALDFYLDTFHQALGAAEAGSVAVHADTEEWVLGSGPNVATLQADRFEVFRCLGGRRTARQIRALNWTGEPERVLGLMSPYPLPGRDLVEH